MFVYRLRTHFGRYNMLGTSVKNANNIPKELLADEKHAKISGEKVYAAITVGEDCFLGASVSPTASEENLTQAYGQFKQEAQNINPDYRPNTVNTDGWTATINAWTNIFIQVVIIQCFLHAVLKIRNISTKYTKELCNIIVEKAWNVYESETKITFAQRLRRLKEFGDKLNNTKLKVALIKLCSKKNVFYQLMIMTIVIEQAI